MNSSTRNKSSRMLISEVRKLAAAVPALLTKYGCINATTDPTWPLWEGRSERYDCRFTVHPIMDADGHPWLACRFQRPDRRPDLPWDAPENVAPFQDAYDSIGANRHTGKFNCHILERMTAGQALRAFALHLHMAGLEYTGHAPDSLPPIALTRFGVVPAVSI